MRRAGTSTVFLALLGCLGSACTDAQFAPDAGGSGGAGGSRASGSGGADRINTDAAAADAITPSADVPPGDTLSTDGPSTDAPPADASGGKDTAPADGPSSAPCASAASLLCDSLRPLPATIKETGFFPTAPDFATVPAGLRPYQPNWELWSDGLTKKRYILLPAAGKIDISDRERWVPPAGTIFIKTFLADGPNGAGTRPIETRIIRRTSDPDPLNEYQLAVYLWNAAGTDAALVDILPGPMPVSVTVAGQTFTHQVPSRMECDRCHTANDTMVIGFDELRLNWKLPGAAATQLETFAATGAFAAALPKTPEVISVPADPLLEKVEGFVQGNCVHCHNGINSTVFDLRHGTFVQNTVGKMTMGSGTNPGLRVDPGRPDTSVLYRQVTRMMLQPGFNPMPPVGVQLAPQDALALLRQWILALPRK